MSIHLTHDLEALHRNLLSMCTAVEEMIHQAVDGLAEPAYEKVRALTVRDDDIDRWDVRIEEECLKILALHQPVAIDLRRITTVLKISSELERVADLGVHIAERACGLLTGPVPEVPENLKQMVHTAVSMLHRSIDSYVELDSNLARAVCAEDDEVDQLNREIIADLIARMQTAPDYIDPALHMFSVVRHVERVADHATNIAEDVVYLVEGRIVRHRTKFEQSEHPVTKV